MDLRDDSRTVVYSGPVVRRTRGETGFLNWTDLTATLLDNYCESFLAVHHSLFSIPISYSHPDPRCEKGKRDCEAAADVQSRCIFDHIPGYILIASSPYPYPTFGVHLLTRRLKVGEKNQKKGGYWIVCGPKVSTCSHLRFTTRQMSWKEDIHCA